MKHWYIVLRFKTPYSLCAGVIYAERGKLHRWYRNGRVAEYRRCRSGFDAVCMALIYNYAWAAWIYRRLMKM